MQIIINLSQLSCEHTVKHYHESATHAVLTNHTFNTAFIDIHKLAVISSKKKEMHFSEHGHRLSLSALSSGSG